MTKLTITRPLRVILIVATLLLCSFGQLHAQKPRPVLSYDFPISQSPRTLTATGDRPRIRYNFERPVSLAPKTDRLFDCLFGMSIQTTSRTQFRSLWQQVGDSSMQHMTALHAEVTRPAPTMTMDAIELPDKIALDRMPIYRAEGFRDNMPLVKPPSDYYPERMNIAPPPVIMVPDTLISPPNLGQPK